METQIIQARSRHLFLYTATVWIHSLTNATENPQQQVLLITVKKKNTISISMQITTITVKKKTTGFDQIGPGCCTENDFPLFLFYTETKLQNWKE